MVSNFNIYISRVSKNSQTVVIGIIDNVSGDCKHIFLIGIFSPAIDIFDSSGR